MDALLTIVIWAGSGFAFSLGIMTGIWMMKSAGHTGQSIAQERMQEALDERNKIGIRQAEQLERIADWAEEIYGVMSK